MAEELGERTEDPTSRRLSQARNRGQVARSQDLSAGITLLAAVIILAALGGGILKGLADLMRVFLGADAPGSDVAGTMYGPMIAMAADRAAQMLVPAMLIIFVVAAISHIMQVGWLWTYEPLKPKLSTLNPISGVKKLFSRRNLVKFFVNIFKLAFVGSAAVLLIQHDMPKLRALPRLEAIPGAYLVARMMFELALILALILVLIGIIDFFYQRWQWKQDLKMTKHEVKDERRSMEGDPQVKKRRLEMAYGAAMQRIQSAVPNADVVVTNPTHFSVAIKYDSEAMVAPRVVAKGADLMAFRIRQVAQLSGVPVIERPPLARALYWNVEEGQEIRPEHYEAVAEILAYVYRMEGRAA